jgi:hypothetical protein
MPDEATVTSINEVKTTSDGSVKISVEKYEELLRKAAEKPPVMTTVVKTAEIAAKEYRLWGGTFMGMGAAMFAVGALLYNAGRVG